LNSRLVGHGKAMRVSMQTSFRPSAFSFQHKFARAAWAVVSSTLFRFSPRPFYAWRRWLLRLFGARLGRNTVVHSTARIWAPWNLTMEDQSCLSHDVDCYAVDKVRLGARSVVSQGAFLCTASHLLDDISMPLVTSPIEIEADAWIAARAYVAPGVRVGRGAVVGACAVVTRDVGELDIVAGNPARKIGKRNLVLPARPKSG
jgi:putative colanic acid biosynthesis acetyltransferase WcaF